MRAKKTNVATYLKQQLAMCGRSQRAIATDVGYENANVITMFKTGTTKVYPIPVKHHGIISVTPDETRNLAYISTCSDERPLESSHFLVLDLKTGEYLSLIHI